MTNQSLCVAAVQMNSRSDKRVNLESAAALIEKAAVAGARLIVLPEMFSCYGRPEAIVAAAEPLPGPTSEFLAELAAKFQIVLVGGSVPERSSDSQRVFNTSLIFGPDGKLLGRYRKLHLFDVDLSDGTAYRESSWTVAGDQLSMIDTPCGRLGQTICYDIRFPEMYRVLAAQGAELLVVPSAFTAQTGGAHWEILVRARAIESQAYVIAANQCGQHTEQIATYGHSLIVDPWGTVLASTENEVGVCVTGIDVSRVAEIRARMPVLQHARLNACMHN